MGSDVWGCIERFHSTNYDDAKKWTTVLDLGVLGRDYTIFMDVFGWCKESELGERNWIPEDWDYSKYMSNDVYEESQYKNCIDGKTALERIQKLIKHIKEDPSYYPRPWYYGGVPPTWITLEQVLQYHTEELRCVAVIWG